MMSTSDALRVGAACEGGTWLCGGDAGLCAIALKALGVMCLSEGDGRGALALARGALGAATLLRKSVGTSGASVMAGDELEARCNANIGNALRALGRADEALPHYHRDLVLAEQLRSAVGRARARNNLALAYEDQAAAAYTAAVAATAASDAALESAAAVARRASARRTSCGASRGRAHTAAAADGGTAGVLSAQAQEQLTEAAAEEARATAATAAAAEQRRLAQGDIDAACAEHSTTSPALLDLIRWGGRSAISNPHAQLERVDASMRVQVSAALGEESARCAARFAQR